jgi:hypothetical protein
MALPPIDPGAQPPATGTGGTDGTTDWKAKYDQAVLESQEYQKRFTGLQGKYQQELERWKQDSTKVTDLSTQLQAAITQKVDVDTQLATTKEQQDRLQTELEVTKATNARMTLIITKFPQLVPFLDVLPDGSAEELEPKLQAFADKLDKFGSMTSGEFKKGETPPAPQGKVPGDAATLWKQVLEAAQKGDMVAYNSLYAEYLKASEKA